VFNRYTPLAPVPWFDGSPPIVLPGPLGVQTPLLISAMLWQFMEKKRDTPWMIDSAKKRFDRSEAQALEKSMPHPGWDVPPFGKKLVSPEWPIKPENKNR
jgi:hypothetical protein